MTKKPKIIYAITDSEYWKVKYGRQAVQFKIYWFNGEHHVKGSWTDSNEVFDLPYIFFHDHLPFDEKPEVKKGYTAVQNCETKKWLIFKI